MLVIKLFKVITVFVSCCSGQWLTVLVSDCLINCIGVLTIICFNVLINLLNFHYFSGVSFYLVYLFILQFNNSELRDLYVHGIVDSCLRIC